MAADHNDPPQRFDDAVDEPDDIADVFAWAEDGRVKYVLTFGGPSDPGNPPAYDRNVVYLIHTSTDGDASTSENTIDVRFAQDANGNWGVRMANVPDTTGPIVGPVETNLGRKRARARAGQFDDPFFFDLTGFEETTMTGTLAISNDVADDDFAGKNVTAVVIDVPLGAAEFGGSAGLAVWAETRRIDL